MPQVVKPYTFVPNPPASNAQPGCCDWQNGLGHFFAGDYYQFNLSTRSILNHLTGVTTVTFPNIPLNTSKPCISVSPADGNIYGATITPSQLFMGYSPSTGALLSNFNNTVGLPGIGNMCACSAGGAPIVVGVDINSGQGTPAIGSSICAVNMQTLTALGPALTIFVDEYNSSIAPGNAWVGRGGDGQAVAATLGLSARPASVPATMGLYRISLTNSSWSMTRVGGHVAADFGLTGDINFVGIPTLDQSDDNIVCCLQTTTGSFLICKFDGITGAILWQTPIFFLMSLDECRIRHGQLQYVHDSGHVATVNLSTGALTLDTYTPGSATTGRIYYDDTRDLLVFNNNNASGANPQWSTFGLPPSPLVIGGGVIRIAS